MNERLFIFVPMRTRDESKEAAIREKAMSMIVKEGFDGLSMQKLARAAKVSPATIYIYYKNREDLLNQLYNDVQQTFSDVALEGFSPDVTFEEGLWLQWKNRLKFINHYPVHYKFMEQFRNSPLVRHKDVKTSEFKETMKNFVKNAILRKEIKKMEPEMFWSLAYAPFYSLVHFHLQRKTLMSEVFELTEAKIRVVFNGVINSLKP
jgi:TetR/AcrR family transcriptional repressor of multidrug resistance operon